VNGRPDPAPVTEEQERVDVVYARLDELRRVTTERLAAIRRQGPSGSPQNRSERDAFATLYEDRLAQLRAVEERLVFGRLYLRDQPSRYIGRIGMSDEDHAPLLTDWRAPAARPFYQATAASHGDVVRRRHLVTRDRRVTAVEDEVLDVEVLDAEEVTTLSGEGALLAALGAPRTGRMGDIVATIQAEQDAIIRSDLAGVLVVQGGPGTGKTAVALHRAAYLLYAHREQLERSGVLLVGPSQIFLRYIEQVLPSLGETGVVATTIGDLLPGVRATASEAEEVAAVKGQLVMARVVERAVRARQRVPEHAQELRVGSHVLVLEPDVVRTAQAKARRASRAHNQARVTFVRAVLGELSRQYADVIGGAVAPEDLADLAEEIRTSRDARVAINLAWMPLTPQGLLEDLYARPERLAQAAPELSARDRALLARDRGSPWTPADIPLLDEAAELLGEDDAAQRAQARAEAARRESEVRYARDALAASGAGHGMVSAEMLAARFAEAAPATTTAERAAADRTWTYGHVVVDEAQELSPMAWRVLLRRIPTRSMTVVGDLAQATRGGARSWGAVLDRPLRGSWRVAELSVNYRTPAEVMEVATRTAHAAGHPTTVVRSAREVAGSLRFSRPPRAGTDETEADALFSTMLHALRTELAELDGGHLAVIAPPARRTQVAAAVADAARQDRALADALHAEHGDPMSARIAVLDPVGSKGLEFDVVVLVEPAEIAADGSGPRPADLYVAMTRATRRLHVVAAGELPAAMSDEQDRFGRQARQGGA
jgi:DNA helicase IV